MGWTDEFAQSIADLVNGAIGPPATFLEYYVWEWGLFGVPLLVGLLLFTGLFVTLRLGFIQVRGFRHAVNITRGKYDDPEDEGDLSHFQALTTALSATVGIGNIAGVAIAIRMGGPGALFWMWITAFFGMALKFTECTLALSYRHLHKDGSVSGGPMYYIEKGLGPNWKWMAMIFATCAAVSSFGGGCMNQSNTLADLAQNQFGIPTVISGAIFAALVGTVIIGGIRRIGAVTSILAPGMAALYVAGALIILVMRFQEIPAGLALIVSEAFSPSSLGGGAAGSLMLTMMWGIRRGLFSNEAGQGSAPIAHATAKTKEPIREGLVASLEPFIDTLVICTMTGLVIVLTGAYRDQVPQTLPLGGVTAVVASAGDTRDVQVLDGALNGVTLQHLGYRVDSPRFTDADGAAWTGSLKLDAEGTLGVADGESEPILAGEALLTGAPLTARAFRLGLGDTGGLIVTFGVILFAVSTGISWSYYGDRSVEYVFGARAIPIYRWTFIAFFFFGAILPLRAVWTFGDVALGLMTIPNLIALLLLSGKVSSMMRDYFSREQVRTK